MTMSRGLGGNLSTEGLFLSYDTKKAGVLSTEECTNLLAALGRGPIHALDIMFSGVEAGWTRAARCCPVEGFHVRTVEEQQDLKGLLQQAGVSRTGAVVKKRLFSPGPEHR